METYGTLAGTCADDPGPVLRGKLGLGRSLLVDTLAACKQTERDREREKIKLDTGKPRELQTAWSTGPTIFTGCLTVMV